VLQTWTEGEKTRGQIHFVVLAVVPLALRSLFMFSLVLKASAISCSVTDRISMQRVVCYG
jgi:hypothetical protein